MAKKKKKKKAKSQRSGSGAEIQGKPQFPYVTNTNRLREVLRVIPQKPRPDKLTNTWLASWGFTSSNDRKVLAVLRKLKFIDGTGQPTERYDRFMMPGSGGQVMDEALREEYAVLYGAFQKPASEDDQHLRRVFNLHSGGSDKTMAFQIQTFKALSEFASTDGVAGAVEQHGSLEAESGNGVGHEGAVSRGGATVHIDLHIHLPENKSARDYQAIIEDIGRYLYGGKVDE